MLRRHVSPEFGHRQLSDIKRSEVRDFQMRLFRDGFSISTSNRTLATLSSLFDYAEYLGYVPLGMSPCYKVSTLPRQRREAYKAPPEKVEEMLSTLGKSQDKQAKVIRLIVLTGARKGEILRAQWPDVDWEKRRLRSVRDMHGETRWLDLCDDALHLKSISQEFYKPASRRGLCSSLEELQSGLDDWLWNYNNYRTRQGKICCGTTPVKTLLDGLQLWEEKSDT